MKHSSSGQWLGVALLFLTVSLSMSVAAEQSPRELYERARLLEENVRNLNRAIELYEQVVALAKADRPLAGAAQLRVGILKERQGKPEARAVFATVVHEYPDQRELVSTAKARLAAVTARAGDRRSRLGACSKADGQGWSISPRTHV